MNIMKEKDELLELVEHLNKYEHCKKCIHLASCDSWIRHGTRLYDDYDYSVKNCPYFEDLRLGDCSNIYQQCVEDIKVFYKENKFAYEAQKLGEELDEFLEKH